MAKDKNPVNQAPPVIFTQEVIDYGITSNVVKWLAKVQQWEITCKQNPNAEVPILYELNREEFLYLWRRTEYRKTLILTPYFQKNIKKFLKYVNVPSVIEAIKDTKSENLFINEGAFVRQYGSFEDAYACCTNWYHFKILFKRPDITDTQRRKLLKPWNESLDPNKQDNKHSLSLSDYVDFKSATLSFGIPIDEYTMNHMIWFMDHLSYFEKYFKEFSMNHTLGVMITVKTSDFKKDQRGDYGSGSENRFTWLLNVWRITGSEYIQKLLVYLIETEKVSSGAHISDRGYAQVYSRMESEIEAELWEAKNKGNTTQVHKLQTRLLPFTLVLLKRLDGKAKSTWLPDSIVKLISEVSDFIPLEIIDVIVTAYQDYKYARFKDYIDFYTFTKDERFMTLVLTRINDPENGHVINIADELIPFYEATKNIELMRGYRDTSFLKHGLNTATKELLAFDTKNFHLCLGFKGIFYKRLPAMLIHKNGSDNIDDYLEYLTQY